MVFLFSPRFSLFTSECNYYNYIYSIQVFSIILLRVLLCHLTLFHSLDLFCSPQSSSQKGIKSTLALLILLFCLNIIFPASNANPSIAVTYYHVKKRKVIQRVIFLILIIIVYSIFQSIQRLFDFVRGK